MTKKRVLSALLLSSLFLTACNNSDESGNDPDPTEEVPADNDTESEPDPDDGQNDEDENNDPDSENDDEIEETPEEYFYEVSNVHSLVPIEGTNANEQVALLTYDDAPDGYTLEIAETLVEYDAPAIFFVNGMYLESEENQEILREIYDMGFAIGNHTYTHPDLQSISEEQQYEEIVHTSDLVEEVVGERPRFFRAPFGQNTDYSRTVAEEDGMVIMNWTYGYDWEVEYQEPNALADIMINTPYLSPGANLLMHDREWTMQATPAIIEGLRDQGYELLDPNLIQSVNSEDTESEETD